MMKFKNFFFAAALVMMLAACSVNEDNPSGGEISSVERAWEYILELLKNM